MSCLDPHPNRYYANFITMNHQGQRYDAIGTYSLFALYFIWPLLFPPGMRKSRSQLTRLRADMAFLDVSLLVSVQW